MCNLLSVASNTILVPCRHVCMCYDCASKFCMDSDTCPIYRTKVTQILKLDDSIS